MRPLPAMVACLLAAACADPPRSDMRSAVAQPIILSTSLWQAARETVDFLPLEATDPVAGTIRTGWGTARGGDDGQRFRIALDLDYTKPPQAAVYAIVRRQVRSGEGWVEAQPDAAAAIGIQHDIAAYAEELRRAEIAGN